MVQIHLPRAAIDRAVVMYYANVYIGDASMVRTQIYLTEEERTALSLLSSETGKPQSELIREAVDQMVGQFSKARRDAVLNDTAGLWKDREDLPDFDALRRQWDRGGRT